ncbi:MAG: hypothetical protein ACI35O_16500 [Bacillaceae bacterium]
MTGPVIENKKLHHFMRILELNKHRLNQGAVINVRLKDGFLTIFNEIDEVTKESKTITLIDEFDYNVNLTIADLSRTN